MKILFIFIFFILHCGSVYFVGNDAPVLTDEELNLLKSRKIGLIGFSPFRISKFSEIHTAVHETVNDPAYRKMLLWLDKNGKTAEYNENMFLMFTGGKYAKVLRAYPDRKNRTLKFTGFGTEIGSLKWEEGESSRNAERTAEMAADWHSRMNHYAFADLKLILDFSEYEMNPKIRKYDADYWVTAYHGPVFTKQPGIWGLTVLPFILTLGTVPLVNEKEKISVFRIYDSHMSIVKEINYKEDYRSLTAWWVLWTETSEIFTEYGEPPASVYEPDVRKFSKEFAEILKKGP